MAKGVKSVKVKELTAEEKEEARKRRFRGVRSQYNFSKFEQKEAGINYRHGIIEEADRMIEHLKEGYGDKNPEYVVSAGALARSLLTYGPDSPAGFFRGAEIYNAIGKPQKGIPKLIKRFSHSSFISNKSNRERFKRIISEAEKSGMDISKFKDEIADIERRGRFREVREQYQLRDNQSKSYDGIVGEGEEMIKHLREGYGDKNPAYKISAGALARKLVSYGTESPAAFFAGAEIYSLIGKPQKGIPKLLSKFPKSSYASSYGGKIRIERILEQAEKSGMNLSPYQDEIYAITGKKPSSLDDKLKVVAGFGLVTGLFFILGSSITGNVTSDNPFSPANIGIMLLLVGCLLLLFRKK